MNVILGVQPDAPIETNAVFAAAEAAKKGAEKYGETP